MPMSNKAKGRLVILLIAAAGVAAAGAGLYTLRQATQQRTLSSAREQGLAAYEQENWDETLRHLGRYIGTNREDAEAWLATADARHRVPADRGNHIAEALGYTRHVLSMEPNNTRALRLALELEVQLGQRTEALQTADRLLAIDANDRDALGVKAVIQQALGNEPGVRQAIARLDEAYPEDFDAQFFVVSRRMDLGDDPRVIASELALRLEQNPQNLSARLVHALVLQRAGLLDRARESARAIEPAALTARAELMGVALRLYDVLGMQAEAEKIVTLATGGNAQTSAVLVAAERAWKNGSPNEALRLIEPIRAQLTSASDRELGWSAFLDAAIGLGEQSPLLRALQSRSTAEARGWVELVRGFRELDAQRPARARAVFRAILERDRSNELAWFLLGDSDLALAELRSAADAYRQTLRTDPRWLTAHVRLSETLMSLGEARAARDAAAEAMRAFPREGVLLDAWLRATVALAQGPSMLPEELASAIRFLERLVQVTPDDGALLGELAKLRAIEGETQIAGMIVARLLDEERELTPARAASVVDVFRARGVAIDPRLQAMASRPTREDAFERAMQALREGRADEGREIIEQAARDATGEADRKTVEVWRALYKDRAGDEDAPKALGALSSAHPEDARVQLAVLGAESIWRSPENAQPVIGRLRELTGEQATNWRVHESRRLLLVDRGERQAANVATLLGPVLRREPDNVRALLLMSEAMSLLGDRDASIAHLNRAVIAAPERTDLLPPLIAQLQAAGRENDAREAMERLATAGGLDLPARRARADLLIRQGMYSRAIAELESIADASGEVNDRLRLAGTLTQSGRPDRAARIFESLLETHGSDVGVLQAAAEFYAMRGEMTRAESLAEQLPEDEHLRARFGAVLQARYGDPSEGERRLVNAIRTGNASTSVHLALVRHRAAHADPQGALQAAEQGAAAHPNDGRLARLVALLRAAEAFGEDRDGVLARTLVSLANLPSGSGADELLTVAAQVTPGGASDRVRTGLRRVVDQNPGLYEAAALQAALELHVGNADEAASIYRAAGARMPGNPAPLAALTELLLSTGRLDAAAVAAADWRRRVPGDPIQADMVLAQIDAELRRWASVQSTLEPHEARLIEAADRAPAGLLLLARAHAAQGRVDRAASMLGEHIGRDAAWGSRAIGIGSVIPSPVEARRWIERCATSIEQQSPSALHRAAIAMAWFDLAQRTLDDGDLRRVIASADRMEPSDRDSSGVTVLAALSAEQLGDRDRALELYRRAAEAEDPSPVVLNNLAYLLLRDENNDGRESVAMARRAVAGGARMPIEARSSFLDTLGVALLRTREHAEAEARFREAMRLTPGEARLRVGLGEALAGQGRTDEARQELERLPRDRSALDEAVRRRLEALESRLRG
mgnify:CR=1 FL=1